MATINSSEIIRELIEVTGIQPSRDKIPSELADKILPVLEVNPKLTKNINFTAASSSTTTGGFGITMPTAQPVFITNLTASYSKDATANVATGRISVTAVINGATRDVATFAVITLTAESATITIHFNPPLRLDIGTTFSFNGTFTLGVLSRTFCIAGFTYDLI